MKDVVLKYGFRSALTMVVLSWLSFFITKGMNPWAAQVASLLVVLVSLFFIYGAMSAEKARLGTTTSFWQYFFTGALTGLIPAVVMIASTVVFMFTAGRAYSSWSESDTGQVVIMNPVEQGIIMFLIILFIGSIMSLVGAIVFSTRKK